MYFHTWRALTNTITLVYTDFCKINAGSGAQQDFSPDINHPRHSVFMLSTPRGFELGGQCFPCCMYSGRHARWSRKSHPRFPYPKHTLCHWALESVTLPTDTVVHLWLVFGTKQISRDWWNNKHTDLLIPFFSWHFLYKTYRSYFKYNHQMDISPW